MELTVVEAAPELVRAGYACPCGCTPSVEYARNSDIVGEGCCCGNHFAVGPRATSSLSPRAGFRSESQAFEAPWGEQLEAAWLIGPSVHGSSDDHEHSGDHGHHPHDEPAQKIAAHAVDPVCGMAVDPEIARAKGLHSTHDGVDFYFCGKGCKLDFDENPQQHLDPAYVPSM